jgi:tryptophan-rich sensory protein
MSSFAAPDVTMLLALISFVFFEIFHMEKHHRDWYESHRSFMSSWLREFIPSWIFGPVWFVVKSCQVIAMYFFLKYHTNEFHYTYLVNVICFIVAVAENKMWTPVFFEMQWTGLALGKCLFVWALVLVQLIMIGMAGPPSAFLTGSAWYAPLIPQIFVVAWLTCAAFLNYEFIRAQWKKLKVENPKEYAVRKQARRAGRFNWPIHHFRKEADYTRV